MLTSFKYNKRKRINDGYDVLPGRERFAIRSKTLREEGGNSMIDRVRLKPMNDIDSMTFESGRRIPPRHVRFKLHHNNVEKGGHPMWTMNDEGGNFVPRPPLLGGIPQQAAARVGNVLRRGGRDLGRGGRNLGRGITAGVVAGGNAVAAAAPSVASGVAGAAQIIGTGVQAVGTGVVSTLNFLRNGVTSWLGQRAQQGGQLFQPRIPQQPDGRQNQPLLPLVLPPPQVVAAAAEPRSGVLIGPLKFGSKGSRSEREIKKELRDLEKGIEDYKSSGASGFVVAESKDVSGARKRLQEYMSKQDELSRRAENILQVSAGHAQLSNLNNSVPMLPDVNQQDTPQFVNIDLERGVEYKTPAEIKQFYDPFSEGPRRRKGARLEFSTPADERKEDRTPVGQYGAVTPRVGDRSTRNLKGQEPYMQLGGGAYMVVQDQQFASNSDPMFVTQGDNMQGVEEVEPRKLVGKGGVKPRKLAGKEGGFPRGPRGDDKLMRENRAQGLVMESKLRGDRKLTVAEQEYEKRLAARSQREKQVREDTENEERLIAKIKRMQESGYI